MTEIQVTRSGDPLPDHLERFKMYASVPEGDNTRDGVLQAILKRAMLTVQEAANVALLPCVIELTAYNVAPGDVIPLYEGGKTVTSVKDQDGEDVGHKVYGRRVVVDRAAEAVTVTYENEVVLPEAERLMPVCWELATAIYDGEEASRQASIVRKCYWAL